MGSKIMADAILVVVEESANRAHICSTLRGEGYRVVEAENGKRSLEILARQADIGCVLAQIDLADMKGINFFPRLHAINAHIPIIALVKSEDEPQLTQVLDSGADDFLMMPPTALRLKMTLNTLLRRRNLASEATRVRHYAEDHLKFKDLVANSAKMRDLIIQAKKCLRRSGNILISGEVGCEHELLARIIHREDKTRQGAFVRLQCLDSSKNEAQADQWCSQLATKLKQARGGCLALIDLDRLDRRLQDHLLPLVEQTEPERKENIRFVATIQRPLSILSMEEQFNPQLLNEIGQARLDIAPLRDRRKDIEELCHVILKVVMNETGRHHIHTIGKRTIAMLSDYDWPGNLAELENALFHAVLLSNSPVLSPQDFPQIWHKMRLETIGQDLKKEGLFAAARAEGLWDEFGHIRPLDVIEQWVIESAYERYEGRWSEVARRLGIGRSTLYRKMESYSERTHKSVGFVRDEDE